MASIEERKRADGTTAYKAEVVIRIDGKRKKKSATFDRKTTAHTWAKKVERQMKASGGAAFFAEQKGQTTVGELIQLYVDDTSNGDFGRTKAQVLRSIQRDFDIANMNTDEILAHDVTRFARELRVSREPSTVMNYLQHLSSVMRYGKPGYGVDTNKSEVADGIAFCAKQGIASKSNERDRRPTINEIDKLMEYFVDQSHSDPRMIPMHYVTTYAMFSARRQAEICRITWQDYSHQTKWQMVRSMKNPGKKKGVDMPCEVTPEALRIMEFMRKSRFGNDERIFPFNSDTVSRRFTDACKILGIDDLRFHDLRHEAASRLFELGRTIPQVSSVTGHKSWKSLERYTNLQDTSCGYDKWRGWKWWSILEKL